jgi:hypothetical protein
MPIKKILISAASIAGSLAQAAQSLACSVCLTGSSDAAVDGYNASVLFLMATPYLVAGAIAAGLFFSHRRAVKRTKGLEEEQAMMQLTWNQEDSGR